MAQLRPTAFVGMKENGGRNRSGSHQALMGMDEENSRPKKSIRETVSTLPQIWELLRPRRGLLALGFTLMVINRVSGLVLPASTKFLIDDVIGQRHTELLLPLVGAVLAATAVQGITSFALTQSLSK